MRVFAFPFVPRLHKSTDHVVIGVR